MVDELPKEVDYVSAKLYDESGNEVTDGTITYDENAHKVTWTANNTFLSSMPLKGETYTLKINVKLNSKMGKRTTNSSYSLINNEKLNSNIVEVLTKETTIIVPNTLATASIILLIIGAIAIIVSGVMIYRAVGKN